MQFPITSQSILSKSIQFTVLGSVFPYEIILNSTQVN